jgi:hypothetical protein
MLFLPVRDPKPGLIGDLNAPSQRNPDTEKPMQYVPPAFEAPYRVMLFAAAAHGWYQAADDERERILARLTAYFAEWESRGARLLYSFDDDYFVTGQPS